MPVRTDYPEGSLSWADLATSDPAGAQSFYGALFGWSFQANPIEGGGEYISAAKDGHAVAGIFQKPPQMDDLPTCWNLYATVASADEAVDRVAAAGGQVYEPPFDVMEEGRTAVVGDPAGAALCLWQAKTGIGAELVGEPGSLVWAELITPDQPAAAAFYAAVVGWESQAQPDGPVGPTTMFSVGGTPIAAAVGPPDDQVPPCWMVSLGVEDCDAACEAVVANGGTVAAGPFDTPMSFTTDQTANTFTVTIRTAVVADPAGAVFKIAALTGRPG